MKQQLRFFFVLLSFSLVLPFAAGALDDANGSYDFSDNNTVSGTLVDQAEQYNGSLNGVQTGVSGILNEAYSFDGNDDYVEFEDTDWSERDEFSVSIWAYFEDTSSNQYLYSPPYDGSSNHPWHLKFDTNQVTLEQVIFRNFDNQGGRGQLVETGFTPSKNEWHHIVAVNNGSEQKIYWNNSVVGTGSYSGYDSVNIDKYAIGAFWHEGEQNYDGSFDGRLDEARFYDRALSPSEVGTLYNQGEGFDPYAQPTNFTLAAEDAFDGSSLANFSISVRHLDAGSICPGGNCSLSAYNVSTYNTTNGLITTDLTEDNTDDIRRINFSAQAYEDRKYDDLSIDPSNQTSFTGFLRQAQSKFTTAQTLVTNKTLTSFNVTINGQTFQSNTTFPSPTRYNATFTKDGWFNKTQEYDVATLNQEFTGVYDQKTNITAKEELEGSTVSNFSGKLLGPNNYEKSFNTTNSSVLLNIEKNKEYTVYIDSAPGFAVIYENNSLIMNETFKTNNSNIYNQKFETFTYNTVNFNAFDVETNELLNQNVNVSIINGPEDRQKSEKNGSILIQDLLTGSYTARFESADFATQDLFFTVKNRSYQEIDLYLDKTSTTIFFTVRDTLRDPVDNAVMTMKTKINGSNVLIGQRNTDFSGTASFSLNPSRTYTFTVVKDGFSTFEGTLTPTLTEYTVTLSEVGTGKYVNPFGDFEYRTNITVENGTWTWRWATNSEDNRINSQSYNFEYSGETYEGSSSSSSGDSFVETGEVTSQQDRITVNYTVDSLSGKSNFRETFSLRNQFPVFEGFTDIGGETGVVTGAFIAIIITSLFVVVTTISVGSVSSGAYVGAAMLGFFAAFRFLPVSVTLISIGSLIAIGLSLGRMRI